jgi:hypothetical protein
MKRQVRVTCGKNFIARGGGKNLSRRQNGNEMACEVRDADDKPTETTRVIFSSMPNNPHPNADGEAPPLAPAAALLATYSLAILGAIFLILETAKGDGTLFFEEGNVLEWFQVGFLALGAAFTCVASYRLPGYGALLRCLGFLCALAAIRELDKDLDALIPIMGWQAPFALILLFALVTAWRYRHELPRQIRIFLNHRSFGMMWAGFILAIPFGQLIGHGPFLRDLFGEDYERSIKRVIEESAEMIGYLIIAISGIDLTLWLRKRPDAD